MRLFDPLMPWQYIFTPCSARRRRCIGASRRAPCGSTCCAARLWRCEDGGISCKASQCSSGDAIMGLGDGLTACPVPALPSWQVERALQCQTGHGIGGTCSSAPQPQQPRTCRAACDAAPQAPRTRVYVRGGVRRYQNLAPCRPVTPETAQWPLDIFPRTALFIVACETHHHFIRDKSRRSVV